MISSLSVLELSLPNQCPLFKSFVSVMSGLVFSYAETLLTIFFYHIIRVIHCCYATIKNATSESTVFKENYFGLLFVLCSSSFCYRFILFSICEPKSNMLMKPVINGDTTCDKRAKLCCCCGMHSNQQSEIMKACSCARQINFIYSVEKVTFV